ncbi:MerR family transcriptional regulator [Streptomyces sp. MST-110588]|uniref:MerR family transcriptional regulator n=1 Tax=Streptomyces sp. MST-110588 TaxID=2833628 RepID=UPI001F5C9FC4|nr:MerR family transcriptional regulator [Streptomyces sp. MST-110588]UNO40881.1 MerR family transcriptional regulator [Streptomyces sp. MST-110588]
MFSIGDFATIGRVSARMLRHYDAIGLLRPARTDPASGYRFYEAGQLARLNRIIALKDLGFSLQQVGAILDEQVSAEELRGMLRLRRAELAATVTAAGVRLAQVEARLRTIESEGQMSADDIVVKRVESVRVAELTGIADSFAPESIGPVIQPLYEELCRRLAAAGVVPAGPGIAYYESVAGTPGPVDGEEAVVVHAGFVVTARPEESYDFAIVDLPAIERAATVVHRGSMDEIMPTAQHLARWIDANGYRSAGYARELYLECPSDPDRWVTELQEPVTPA